VGHIQSGERCHSKIPALFSLLALFSLFDSTSQIMKIMKIIENENDKIMINDEVKKKIDFIQIKNVKN
jgi:hypothetical protein